MDDGEPSKRVAGEGNNSSGGSLIVALAKVIVVMMLKTFFIIATRWDDVDHYEDSGDDV